MVSYTRARAEALGVECQVGLATRPVRVVILSAGLVFAKGAGVIDVELLAPDSELYQASSIIEARLAVGLEGSTVLDKPPARPSRVE